MEIIFLHFWTLNKVYELFNRWSCIFIFFNHARVTVSKVSHMMKDISVLDFIHFLKNKKLHEVTDILSDRKLKKNLVWLKFSFDILGNLLIQHCNNLFWSPLTWYHIAAIIPEGKQTPALFTCHALVQISIQKDMMIEW